MALTMMLGPPGAGKSYEAVVFHVLPALQSGRKVVTNLPLNVEAFEAFDVDPELIDLVHATKDNSRPFGRVEDYQSDWRHPVSGIGPLFVIDECHFAMPRGGTAREVEEWYSMHRHEGVDLILMTQSYGKVSKAICDIVQTAIILRKNTNLGSQKSYRREVRDGLSRSNRLTVDLRRYKAKFFPLYQSYTRGGKAEGEATDIRPLWRRWQFYGLGLVVLFVGYQALFGTGFQMFGAADKAPAAKGEKPPAQGGASAAVARKPGIGQSVGGLRDLSVVGTVAIGPETVAIFRAIKGGGKATYTANQLIRQGFQITPVGPCLYRIAFRTDQVEVGCE